MWDNGTVVTSYTTADGTFVWIGADGTVHAIASPLPPEITDPLFAAPTGRYVAPASIYGSSSPSYTSQVPDIPMPVVHLPNFDLHLGDSTFGIAPIPSVDTGTLISLLKQIPNTNPAVVTSVKLDPNAAYVFQGPTLGVSDAIGGAAAAIDHGMAGVLTYSNQVAAATIPQIGAAATYVEQQFMKHTMALPSIVSSGISFAAVYDAWKRGDNEGIYVNTASALGGLAATEFIPVLIGATEGVTVGSAIAVGIGAVAGGILAAGVAKIAYDASMGKIDERYGDRILDQLRSMVDSFNSSIGNPRYSWNQ